MGQWEASRKHLTAALKIWDSARLRYLFAVSYHRKGEHWPAIYHARRSVSQARHSAFYRSFLAKRLVQVGKTTEACKILKAGLARSPYNRSLLRLSKRHCS